MNSSNSASNSLLIDETCPIEKGIATFPNLAHRHKQYRYGLDETCPIEKGIATLISVS